MDGSVVDQPEQQSGLNRGDGPDLVEAGAAIDGAIQSWQKRHQGGCAALGARNRVQPAWSLAEALAPPIDPTLMAPLRLIQQPPLGEERLLAG